jgi:succinyl-CoA synthetase beta subunit
MFKIKLSFKNQLLTITFLQVMVAEAIDITRETYFCILMDRESNGPVLVASPGINISTIP